MSHRNISLVLAYAALAGLWIAFSDRIVEFLVEDPSSITGWQTIKGTVFVALTALLLYLLLLQKSRDYAAILGNQQGVPASSPLIQKTFSKLTDAILIVEAPSRLVVSCNNAVERIFGYSPEELIGSSTEILHLDHEHFTKFANEFDSVLVRDGEVSTEYRLRRRDGIIIDTEITVTLLDNDQSDLNQSGNLKSGYVVTIIRDITERKQSEEQQRLSAMVFDNANEAIVIGDTDKRIFYANPAFHEMTGYSPDEVFAQDASMLDAGTHDDDFYRIMWETVDREGHWVGEVSNRRRNGQTYPAWLSISAVRDKSNNIVNYIGIATDLSEQRRLNERVRYLSFHDSVTGLLNRDAVLEHLEQTVSHARRDTHSAALLMLNIDRFKMVNDSLGHPAGDQLLKRVAHQLSLSVRDGDAVGRLAADQFALVLSDLARPEDVTIVLDKVLERTSGPFGIDDTEVYVSFSTGIAVYPRDADEAKGLVRNASAAMNEARREGGNRYRFFTEHMHQQAMERLTLESELRGAAERGELFIQYQPQVSVKDGQIIGCEALLRWNSARFGRVSPAKFIPLAEETGLIIPIGHWVLETVCRQIKDWLASGITIDTVSINLSARQIHEAQIVRWVQDTLDGNKLAPEILELELTESAVMSKITKTITIMEELKRIGARMSIDDFGTGYSSLSYLKRFPLDTLKIDRSFVQDIASNSDDAAIAEAIIVMARNMGMRVIAEGVETREQLEILQQKGCDTVQGYFFSPAVDAESFAALTRRGFAAVRPGTEPAPRKSSG